jgi:hypothetical protein
MTDFSQMIREAAHKSGGTIAPTEARTKTTGPVEADPFETLLSDPAAWAERMKAALADTRGGYERVPRHRETSTAPATDFNAVIRHAAGH